MILAFVLTLVGLALLVGGAELLVRGSVHLAHRFGVSRAVVGVTVVAIGTSLPELVVTVRAAIDGQAGMSMGNVVGSNTFNIAVVLGAAALVRPLRVSDLQLQLEWPTALAGAALVHLFARDGTLDRLEGGFLLLCFAAFMLRVVRSERGAGEPVAVSEVGATTGAGTGWALTGALVVSGLALLVAGSNVLVRGASDLAQGFGAPPRVIGLTIVAAGTSLPELFASLVAAFRGEDELAIGNVLGSNIFNALCATAIASLIQPLRVPAEIVSRDDWWMLGFTFALGPLLVKRSLGRWAAMLLITAFAGYWATLVRSVTG